MQIVRIAAHELVEYRCGAAEIAGVSQRRAERSQERPVGVTRTRRGVEDGDRVGRSTCGAENERQTIVGQRHVSAALDDTLQCADRVDGIAARPHRRRFVERGVERDELFLIVGGRIAARRSRR